MNKRYAKPGGVIDLGRTGENLAVTVVFDIAPWRRTYGEGTAQLIHIRAGDLSPYPCAVSQEGDAVYWPITSADGAVPGRGEAELQYYVGEVCVKSERYATSTRSSLGAAQADTPAAQQGWVDQVLQASADAMAAAGQAQATLEKAPKIGDNGNWFVYSPSSGHYEDTGCFSGGEAPYIGANGNWFVGQEDSGVSATGPTGKQGATGASGADGYSPTVELTETTDGVSISITDKNGKKTATVRHGAAGTPGKDAGVDATLTEEGKAADAKAVGDTIRQLSQEITAISDSEIDAICSMTADSITVQDGVMTIVALANAPVQNGNVLVIS